MWFRHSPTTESDRASRRPGIPAFGYALPLLVLLGGLGLTWVGVRYQRAEFRKHAQAYFDFRVRDAQTRLEQRLKAYEQVLRDTHCLFITTEVRRKDFRRFVSGMHLQQNFPGIQGLGISLAVPGEARERHEAAVRAEGFPDYAIWPAGRRALHTPVFYLEPFEGRNLRAFGYDTYSEPVRRAAMDLARDLDEVTISGKVRLVQETDQAPQAGFLMYLPVFNLGSARADAPTATLAQRRAAIRAWVLMPLRMDDFMNGVLGERAQDLDIEVYDGLEPRPESLMYDSDQDRKAEHPASAFQARQRLEVGRHTWTLWVTSLPPFEARLGASGVRTVFLGGLSLSLLLALLTWVLVSARDQALALADSRETRFKTLMQQANDSILLHDAEGRILEANQQATRFFGYTPKELAGMRIADLHWPEEHLTEVSGRFEALLAHGADQFETTHRHKSGAPLDSEVSSRLVEIQGERLMLSLVRDVSVQKRLREELSQLARLQSTILENTTIGISFVQERRQIWCNARMAELVGHSMEAMAGQSTRMFYPSEEAFEQVGGAAYSVLQAGGTFHTVFQMLRSDGSIFWVDLHGKAVNAKDASAGSIWTFEDISDKKRDQDQLKQLLREQEIILANASAGIALLVDWKAAWMNDWLLEALQYAKAELAGQTPHMLWPSQEACDQAIREAEGPIRRGEAFDTVQQLVRRDGEFLWFKISGRAIDPADLGQGVLWVLVDITAQKQAEEALRESEAHFRSMFESHRAVMLMIDPKDGRIVEANAAAAGFYGYSQERLRGMHIAEINITLSGELAEEMQIAGPTDRKSYVYPHRLASGEIRSVEVNTSATNVQGRTLLFSIIQDITERLLAEARLEDLNRSLDDKVHQALAELRDKDQMLITQGRQAAMGEMIGNIAHQWRQPLSALSVLLGNLKDAQRFGDLEPELVERTTAEGDLLIQKMSSTIRDFAQFFRPDKAQVVFSALAQIQQALTLMDAGLTSHRIAVEVEAPRDLQLLGYPNEYSQVILNLLSNAQQAIWDTGTQAGRIVISLDSRGATARVTVRDNGGGIPEAILPKIFDPYFSTKEMGTGIGLYMSKQIIEHSMKGRLGARNLGDGAEFTIDTPLAEGPHEP